jgi:hypothetical protein
MDRRSFLFGMSAIGLLPAVAVACARDDAPADIPPLPPNTPKNLQLPADGTPLFAFLLREIPTLVEKVPCSCCGKMLAECYRGACPPTCRPCNEIGRAIYGWHMAGMSDADVIALVKVKYPRSAM